MIDLHTHILPGMDDGARNPNMSISMLQLEAQQGIDTVVLTPHFYPEREDCSSFLKRRSNAMEALQHAILRLPEEERRVLPRLLLGAEVAWFPGMEHIDGIEQLCIAHTSAMLLELPFFSWSRLMVHQLYDFVSKVGATPILAHLERYSQLQPKQRFLDVLEMGLPAHVGTDMLRGMYSPAMKLLKKGYAQLVASDCHGLSRRAPDLGTAMAYVEKKLGTGFCLDMEETLQILLEPKGM